MDTENGGWQNRKGHVHAHSGNTMSPLAELCQQIACQTLPQKVFCKGDSVRVKLFQGLGWLIENEEANPVKSRGD